MRAYGGCCSGPAMRRARTPWSVPCTSSNTVSVCDATIHAVLRKLLRGPLPVVRGQQKTFVEGPVDYTDLRTEFIGLIYEGLLDYRLKRTDERPARRCSSTWVANRAASARLEDMLAEDTGLKDLLTKLRKEKVTAT